MGEGANGEAKSAIEGATLKGDTPLPKPAYRAVFVSDDDGVTVNFPDIPMAITGTANMEEAIEEARDCLDEAIHDLLARDQLLPNPTPIPVPNTGPPQRMIPVPWKTAGKARE